MKFEDKRFYGGSILIKNIPFEDSSWGKTYSGYDSIRLSIIYHWMKENGIAEFDFNDTNEEINSRMDECFREFKEADKVQEKILGKDSKWNYVDKKDLIR